MAFVGLLLEAKLSTWLKLNLHLNNSLSYSALFYIKSDLKQQHNLIFIFKFIDYMSTEEAINDG